jgi:hypothetical protein
MSAEQTKSKQARGESSGCCGERKVGEGSHSNGACPCARFAPIVGAVLIAAALPLVVKKMKAHCQSMGCGGRTQGEQPAFCGA